MKLVFPDKSETLREIYGRLKFDSFFLRRVVEIVRCNPWLTAQQAIARVLRDDNETLVKKARSLYQMRFYLK
jgi:hypothetical protein